MTTSEDTSENVSNSQDAVKKSSNKISMILIALVIFTAVGFYLFKEYGNTLSINQSNNPETQLATNIEPYDKSKYNKEYFDQAMAENRELNSEEQYAYYALGLEGKDNSIMSSVINNNEVKCFVNDSPIGESTIDYNINIKQGNVRIDITDVKNSNVITDASLIAKDEGFWSWSLVDDSMNGFASFANRTEKLGLVLASLQGIAEDPSIYNSSCKEESISDSNFELPENIEFQDIRETMMREQEAPVE